MFKGMLRRVFGLLAAVSVAAIPVLGQSQSASAATGGTLFAITGPNQSVLSRLDPATGVITPIEDLAGPDQGQLVSLSGDPASHRLFATRMSTSYDPATGIVVKTQILTINSQTGTYSVSPLVNAPIDLLAFDPSTGVLYALAFNGVYTVDPTTGATRLLTDLSGINSYIVDFAVAPGAHRIYVSNFVQSFVDYSLSETILTIDTGTGQIVGTSSVPQPGRVIGYDASLNALFGVTECCPRQFFKVDPASGGQTFLSAFGNSNDQSLQFAMAIDPASHTAFMDLESFIGFNSSQDQIVSINEQTGATNVSPPINDFVWSQFFEPVVITPDSIKSDVRQALASGAITSPGIASSLLAELDAAEASRSRGLCQTSANIYQAFINELSAQSGKGIAAATAAQLISEAQYLIAHCP